MTGAALTKFGRAPRTCVITFASRSLKVLSLARHSGGQDALFLRCAGLAARARRPAAGAPARRTPGAPRRAGEDTSPAGQVGQADSEGGRDTRPARPARGGEAASAGAGGGSARPGAGAALRLLRGAGHPCRLDRAYTADRGLPGGAGPGPARRDAAG